MEKQIEKKAAQFFFRALSFVNVFAFELAV